jgi:hypothetical protein
MIKVLCDDMSFTLMKFIYVFFVTYVSPWHENHHQN